MPTNQTANYQLSQWVKSDQVKMEDFNADNAKIDEALGALAATAAAHTAAIAKLGNCRVELLEYVGTGECGANHPTILNFSGRVVYCRIFGGGQYYIIRGENTLAWHEGYYYEGNEQHSGTGPSTLVWEGNTAKIWGPQDPRTQMNSKNNHYYAVAFYAEDGEA